MSVQTALYTGAIYGTLQPTCGRGGLPPDVHTIYMYSRGSEGKHTGGIYPARTWVVGGYIYPPYIATFVHCPAVRCEMVPGVSFLQSIYGGNPQGVTQ